MTERKIDLDSFHKAILDVKAGRMPDPVKVSIIKFDEEPEFLDKKKSQLENFLYSNLRYWAMRAINDYILDTPLEENISGGIDGPPRKDEEVIGDVKYDRGISLIGFIAGVVFHNIVENKLYEDALTHIDNDIEMNVLENMSMSILNEATNELIDEYEFDIDILLEGYEDDKRRFLEE